MAITATNVTYISAAAPSAGSTTLAFGGQSVQELSYIGTSTITGDGSTTSAVVNFIDGSNNLAFTPTAVLAFRIGGNTTATQAVAAVNTINAQGFTVQFSAAPGSSNTAQLVYLILK